MHYVGCQSEICFTVSKYFKVFLSIFFVFLIHNLSGNMHYVSYQATNLKDSVASGPLCVSRLQSGLPGEVV